MPRRKKVELLEGLKRLRKGALFRLVFGILGVAFFNVLIPFANQISPSLWYYSLGIGVLLAVTALISLFAYFVLWFLATGNFKRYNPARWGVGRTGIILLFVGLVIAGLSRYFVGTPDELLILNGLGYITWMAGDALFALMLWRFPEESKMNLKFRATGVIYLLSTVAMNSPYVVPALFFGVPKLISDLSGTILAIMGSILTYKYSGRSLKALSRKG